MSELLSTFFSTLYRFSYDRKTRVCVYRSPIRSVHARLWTKTTSLIETAGVIDGILASSYDVSRLFKWRVHNAIIDTERNDNDNPGQKTRRRLAVVNRKELS